MKPNSILKRNRSVSWNKWSHPFWKYGCLTCVVVIFIGLMIDLLFSHSVNKESSASNQIRIDSLRNVAANLSFDGFVLGNKFNKNNLKSRNLKIEDNSLDSANYSLRHDDLLYNDEDFTAKQNISVYTTNNDIIYKIVVEMPKNDLYIEAFFEKYDINLAIKNTSMPNSTIYRWEWSNQNLSLDINRNANNLIITYIDEPTNKLHSKEKLIESDNKIKESVNQKEKAKASI